MNRFRALALALLFLFVPQVFAQTNPAPQRTAGLKRNDGIVPFYWDEKKGDLLFELSPQLMHSQLLHFTSLSTGVGSTNLFADRSSLGASNVVHFERNGPRVFVVIDNTDFRADSGSQELKNAVTRGFPTSIIAALPIEAEENGNLIVKANPLIVRDAFGLLGQFKRPSRFVGGVTVRDQGGSTNWR